MYNDFGSREIFLKALDFNCYLTLIKSQINKKSIELLSIRARFSIDTF